MANNIKGITVEIGGDTGPLNKALKDSDKVISNTQSELKEVNRQLKFDPTNTELLTQKQKLLATEISGTKDRLNTLKEAQRQAKEQFESGKLGEDKYRALQREVIKTESQLKNLEKQAGLCEASLSKISAVSGKVGTAAESAGKKLIPVTLAIGAAGTAAVKMGSDFIESANKSEVAFGASSQAVEKWSKTTLDSFGIAQGSALDMAALYGDMGTSMGFTQQKAAEMSMSLVGLAGDLASFKNISLEESQTALKSIFTGETESLKNLGIVMTDTNLQQYAYAQGIKKKTSEMTESEKVQLRYNFVMDKTKNAQGDFARTSDGAANSMRVASESAKEAGESFGVLLAPVIAKTTQYIASLIKNFAGLDTGAKQIILVVFGIIAALGPALLIIGNVMNAVSAMTGAMVMMKTATLAQTAAQYGWNAALLANPTTWIVVGIIAALALLVVGIKHLWDTNEEFRAAVINIWDNIKTTVGSVVDALVTFFTKTIPDAWNNLGAFFTLEVPRIIQGIIAWFNQLPENIGYAIGAVLAGIVNFGVNTWTWITTQLPLIIAGIVSWFAQLPGKVANKFALIVSGAVTWAQNMVTTAATEVPKFISTVMSFIGELPGKMLEVGGNIVKGIWDGINGAVDWLHDRISDFCSGIVDGFKKKLKIHSPSVLFADIIGKNLALGIGQGFTENMKAVVATMTAAIPTTWDTGVEVRTAMAAAYGGYSAAASNYSNASASVSTQSSGGIGTPVINQYFQGKVPTPSEYNRQARRSWQEAILKAKRG